jgi:hypothetical protein
MVGVAFGNGDCTMINKLLAPIALAILFGVGPWGWGAAIVAGIIMAAVRAADRKKRY